MEENAMISYEEALKLLTPAEIKVLEQVEQGYSNKIIAENLEISVRTVHAHRDNICRKLEIQGRGSLVAWILKTKR